MKLPLRMSLTLICTLVPMLAQQEPVHEQEGSNRGARQLSLGVPPRPWLGRELLGSEPGKYRTLIWGHFLVAKAMPSNFNAEAEARHLAEHGIDQFSAVAPREGLGNSQRQWAQTGLRLALGFPAATTADEALRLGAKPSNPYKVTKGEKAKVAPIDPHYLTASLQLASNLLGPATDLRLLSAFHFHDEPSGEVPYYELDTVASPLAAAWEREVRAGFGQGRWGLPKNGFDQSVPESRLAYQKYWAKAYNSYQRTMAETLRGLAPNVPVWSATFWFNAGSDLFWDYGEMGRFLDAIIIDSYASQCEIDFPGRGRWNAGYATQLAADLSGRPVLNHIQVLEYRDATPTPEDILEYASQTLRAGGSGLIYYAIDFPRYAYIRYRDPSRWSMMMRIADALRTLPKVRLPGNRTTGFLLSQETIASQGPRCKENAPYAAYVVLGVHLGAPLRFVSDWGLVQGRAETGLAGLKVLHVGPARFVPAGVREQIADWVRRGGILTLCAEDTFTCQIGENTLGNWREALGVSGNGQTTVAGTEWKVGQGRILMLASNPWVMGAWEKSETLAILRGLQEKHGGGVDEPHWRFRIPLTGN